MAVDRHPTKWHTFQMMFPTNLLERADEDEACEECDSMDEVCIFDGWLALCRDCAEREVAPDKAAA